MRRTRVLALGLALALAPRGDARALTLNATLAAGVSGLTGRAAENVKKASPLVDGDLTVDFGTYAEVGAFFEHNFLIYDDSSRGSLRFFGLILRLGLLGPGSNLFGDTQLGLSQRTGGAFTSEHGVGLGAGIGYRFWLNPYVALSPRLGFRLLPEPFQGSHTSSSTLDGKLLLTFGF